ncbi:MAG: ATP-binding cassette domain-containing protein [Peptococcaceae bacterium]|nr:ATP-binding cassette domain-containing protein [Peptococcaceae bacterium]
MQPIIRTKDLCCQSGNRYLLRDINWEVEAGDKWIVFGLNGSGKTTLLSIVSGYKMATSGTLEVFGAPYSDDNILANRRRMGWVSSSFFDKVYSRESALTIVLSGLTGTMGLDRRITVEDACRAKALLEEWHLARKHDFPFSMLSKGERQNVLIARALIADPDILVLDEPGTGLDVLARERLLRKISDLAETTDKTLIYVTHYPEELLPAFDKGILLSHGRIVDRGPVAEIMSTERLSASLGTRVETRYLDDGRMDLRIP